MNVRNFLLKTRSGLATLHAGFLDLLFPVRCIGCNELGTICCSRCQQRITLAALQRCPICQTAITLGGTVCSLCRTTAPPLTQLIVGSDYTQPLLPKMIHRFKYQGQRSLAEPLGELMNRSLRSHGAIIPDILVPVPLHPRRLRWRGYNQSLELALHISHHLTPGIEIPINNDLIRRIRFTTPQMKIKCAASRWENVKNAFDFHKKNSPDHIRNKRVLLVDDICTTGATLHAIADVIARGHPKEIAAIVIAR